MHRVSAARVALAQRGELRGIIVNTASDGDEAACRRELALEFGVPFDRTHAVPLDLEAMKAHRAQQIPYAAPAAVAFSHATLVAFSNIFSPALQSWSEERVASWNTLVSDVALSLQSRQQAQEEEEEAARSQEAASLRLSLENESLRAQLLSQAADEPAGRRSVLWSVLLGVTLGFAVLALWMRWETTRRASRLAASDVVTSTAAASPVSAAVGLDATSEASLRQTAGAAVSAPSVAAQGPSSATGAGPGAPAPAPAAAVQPRRPAPVARRAPRPAPPPRRVVLERPARVPEPPAASRSKDQIFGGRE